MNDRGLYHFPIPFACPNCKVPLRFIHEELLKCLDCGTEYPKKEGIWRLLTAEDATFFSRFILEYEEVRYREGRGSNTPDYYRALPYKDITGRYQQDWKIRGISYRALSKRVVKPLEKRSQKPMRILDLGAGNCWLSNRLVERKHFVVAIDLLVNTWDGLGAICHYAGEICAVQASFDRLPILDQWADLIVFNASLHYSANYYRTMAESLRALHPQGHIVIMDTPFYLQEEDGIKMVAERQTTYQRRFGFPSNVLHSEEFLTFTRLENLGKALGISWRWMPVFYGIRWELRPLLAKLRGGRAPARFGLVVGTPLSSGFSTG